MKKVFFLILGLIISFSCNQRQTDIMTDSIPTNMPISFPKLTIKMDSSQTTLKLSNLSIQVQINGNIVTTTMDLSFYNDMDRILEGSLDFPLENEQVVSRFAMEVNGNLREGVVVEKAKGRQTFEQIVRRKVDPGLLEMTKGNNFRARVYPIPAKGYKRIVIGYEEELDMDKTAWWYRLPLGFQEKVDSFALEIGVKQQPETPTLAKNSFQDLTFQPDGNDGYEAAFRTLDFLPNQDVKVRIPFPKSEKHFVMTEKVGEETYFYLHTRLTPIVKKAKKPKKITLIWDVSESSKSRNVEKELALLDQYFKQLKKVEIELVEFSNVVHATSNFKIKNGNWLKLKSKIESLTYDGGTQLGSLILKKYKGDLIILTTDGLSTLGESELTFSKTPIFVLNSSKSANKAYLKYIAQGSGGRYIDLNHSEIGDLKTALTNKSYQFINAEYDGKIIESTYPNIATPVHNQFSLAGILKNKTAQITLNFGIGKNILHTEVIEIDGNKTASKSDIQRLWAKKKVTVLNMQSKRFEKEITALGEKYSLVTPFTSLIVLETVEDYVEHEIEPPVEFQKEYQRRMAIKEKAEKASIAERNKMIEKELEVIEKWWSKTYSLTKPAPKPKPKKSTSSGGGGYRRSSPNSVAPISSDDLQSMPTESSSSVADAIVVEENEEVNAPNNFRESIDIRPQGSIDLAFDQDNSQGEPTDSPIDESAPSPVNTEASPPVAADKKSRIELKGQKKEEYIKQLEAQEPAHRYAEYLKLKSEVVISAGFFLEVGQFFLEKGDRKTAMRVLSNIAEMDLENREFLKILANQLRQMKEYDLALLLYKEIVRIREEEPQAYRDLALVYAETGEYQPALGIYKQILTQDWKANKTRFKGIKGIVLMEMNNLIANHKKDLDVNIIPKSWIKNLPVDVRVVMNWSSDETDVDLWVTDPWDEKCYYSNKLTAMGARISNDMTNGYGPEEFLLKNAQTGKYRVQANFYGDSRQTVAGNVTVDIQFFTNFGKPNQKVKEITLTLKGVKEEVDIGVLEFSN